MGRRVILIFLHLGYMPPSSIYHIPPYTSIYTSKVVHCLVFSKLERGEGEPSTLLLFPGQLGAGHGQNLSMLWTKGPHPCPAWHWPGQNSTSNAASSWTLVHPAYNYYYFLFPWLPNGLSSLPIPLHPGPVFILLSSTPPPSRSILQIQAPWKSGWDLKYLFRPRSS